MINQENINKLYNNLIYGKTLTTKELINCGFTNNDLRKLKEQGFIRNIKRGEYELLEVESLYNYGLEILSQGDMSLALFCFNKCIELCPNHIDSYYQKLYLHIRKKEFVQATKTLDKLDEITDLTQLKNYKLYLYLLNYLIELPDKYQRLIETNPKNINISTNEEENIELKIENYIYKAKFLPAMHFLNKINTNEQIEIKILRALLSQVIKNEQNISEELIKLAKEERYNDIEVILENKIKNKQSKISEKYCLLLSTIIKDIIKTRNIPIIEYSAVKIYNMFEAIDSFDFELALNLNIKYLTNNNLNKDNLLTILLEKINKLINQIKEEKEQEECIIEEVKVIDSIPDKKEDNINNQEIIVENITIVTFTNLLLELYNQNIENFYNLLKQYLNQINKEEYLYLIINLTKLSILENDSSFLKPILTLTEIEKNTYNFNINIYIKEFYTAIYSKQLDISKIYLDIISTYYKESKNVIDNLNKIFSDTIIKEQNTTSSEIVVTKSNQEKIPELIITEKNNDKSNEITKEDMDLITLNEERELIVNKIHEMAKNGNIVAILKDINWERRKKIHSIITDTDGIYSYGIGFEPKTIVLRIVDPNQERIVFKEVLDNFFEASKHKQYQTCINLGNKLLKDNHFNPMKHSNPRVIFATIGLSYLNKKDISNAITYLTIATELNKTAKNYVKKYDYTEILEQLINSPNTILEIEKPIIIPSIQSSFYNEDIENKGEIKEDKKEEDISTKVTEKIIEQVVELTQNNEQIKKIEPKQPVEKQQEENETAETTENIVSTVLKENDSEEKRLKEEQLRKLEDIAYYISATKQPLKDAREEYNLNEEQILLIKLIYARDYFIEGIMFEGDKLLKEVEKRKCKDNQVRELLEEIKRDRLFYQHRIELRDKRRTINIKKF